MKCAFSRAYIGACNRSVEPGHTFCPEHSTTRCASCQKPATKECNYTGQFVCGFPLCDDCEGFTDDAKPYGTWGFLNHSHRRKTKLEAVEIPLMPCAACGSDCGQCGGPCKTDLLAMPDGWLYRFEMHWNGQEWIKTQTRLYKVHPLTGAKIG